MVRVGLLLVASVGCNQLFGLDDTTLVPADQVNPDFDKDDVPDVDDNCPLSPNPLQENRDMDAVGDACDFCPELATEVNHDEDGDGIGDECDLCPVDPDFQVDGDLDQVGDACDPNADATMPDRSLLFDPFLSLAHWSTSGTPWVELGDAVAPVGPIDPGLPGLGDPDIVLSTTQLPALWLIHATLRSTRPWQSGDSFGMSLVDERGIEVAGCIVQCASSCSLFVRGANVTTSGVSVTATPIEHLEAHYTPGTLNCALNADRVAGSVALTDVTPVLIGEPTVQFTAFAAWR